MKRILELITDVRNRYPGDDFFSDFTHSCRAEPAKRKHYRSYNDALMTLDTESWEILKKKAVQQYMNHRGGQKKQGFFNQLNEALAYRFLLCQGFQNVRFIEEGKKKSPDIRFEDRKAESYCEVKTFGISDDEINRRKGKSIYDGSVYSNLSAVFLKKLEVHVDQAWEQIHSLGKTGLVFIVIRLDDIALDYYQTYWKQLIEFSEDRGFDNVFVKINVRGNRRLILGSGRKKQSVRSK